MDMGMGSRSLLKVWRDAVLGRKPSSKPMTDAPPLDFYSTQLPKRAWGFVYLECGHQYWLTITHRLPGKRNLDALLMFPTRKAARAFKEEFGKEYRFTDWKVRPIPLCLLRSGQH